MRSAFVRVKYRDASIQPKGDNVFDNKCISAKKRLPLVAEVEEGADDGVVQWEKPVMCIEHTQDQNVDSKVYSEELMFRRENYPSFVEKVREHNKYMTQKLKHERMAEKLAESKLMYEKSMAEATSGHDSIDDLALMAKSVVEFEKQRTALQQHEDNEDAELEDVEDENFKIEALNMKEKKLLYLRTPHSFHAPLTKWKRRWLAWKLSSGYYTEPNIKIRSLLGGKYKVVENCISEILPWLYIGKVETAQNETFLTDRKFTHVLNCTDSHPNFFPNSFVYMRVPIDDDESADAGFYFDEVVRFIQRVEQCKGKIFVHCVAGASRAPTMVMAYLVMMKNITLWDAFNFIRARRSIVFPNSHFLYQLALYEIRLNKGSSVKLHEEFYSYEFNKYKVDKGGRLYTRQSQGIFFTTLQLFKKQTLAWNLLT